MSGLYLSVSWQESEFTHVSFRMYFHCFGKHNNSLTDQSAHLSLLTRIIYSQVLQNIRSESLKTEIGEHGNSHDKSIKKTSTSKSQKDITGTISGHLTLYLRNTTMLFD